MSLHDAVRSGDLEALRDRIERGDDVDGRDERGLTPLMWACASGHHECALALMDAGATVDKVNNNGSTALMLACQTRPNSSSSYCENKAACALALLESMLPIREVVVADQAASLKFACERHQVLQVVLSTRHIMTFAPAALASGVGSNRLKRPRDTVRSRADGSGSFAASALARASAHVNDVHSIIVEFARDMLIQRQPENLGLDGLAIVGDTLTSALRAPIEAHYSY